MLHRHGRLGLFQDTEDSHSPTRSEASSHRTLRRSAVLGMVLNRESLGLSDFLSKYLPVSCSPLSCRPAWAPAPGPSTPRVPGPEGASGLGHRGVTPRAVFLPPPAALLRNPTVAFSGNRRGFGQGRCWG